MLGLTLFLFYGGSVIIKMTRPHLCDDDQNEIILELYSFLYPLLQEGKNRQGVAKISHLSLSIIFGIMKYCHWNPNVRILLQP